MDFEFPPKVKALQAKLTAFMDGHIYPNERVFEQQILEDRWRPAPVIEELKAEGARGGAVESVSARCDARGGSDESRICAALRDHGPLADGARSFQLLGAGYGQHGSAGAVRDAGTKRAMAEAVARGRNSVLLRDDRAGRRFFRCDEYPSRASCATAIITSSMAASGGRPAPAIRAAGSASSWARPIPRRRGTNSNR